MQRKSFARMACPIARSLERVGEWWSILILRDALHGLTRFDQFQKSLGIAPNMLARRLDATLHHVSSIAVAGTYRGHGHALALGVDPAALMAELLGRSTGVCGGRAGSMNVVDLEHRLIGCFGIVGGSIASNLCVAMSRHSPR